MKLAIKVKNSIQQRLSQRTSAIKAKTHRQSTAAMKAESITSKKAVKAMKAILMEYSGGTVKAK